MQTPIQTSILTPSILAAAEEVQSSTNSRKGVWPLTSDFPKQGLLICKTRVQTISLSYHLWFLNGVTFL